MSNQSWVVSTEGKSTSNYMLPPSCQCDFADLNSEMLRLVGLRFGIPCEIMEGSHASNAAVNREQYLCMLEQQQAKISKVIESRLISLCGPKSMQQYRFPRSKKKRIRKKWAKRDCNYRLEPIRFRVTFKPLAQDIALPRVINPHVLVKHGASA